MSCLLSHWPSLQDQTHLGCRDWLRLYHRMLTDVTQVLQTFTVNVACQQLSRNVSGCLQKHVDGTRCKWKTGGSRETPNGFRRIFTVYTSFLCVAATFCVEGWPLPYWMLLTSVVMHVHCWGYMWNVFIHVVLDMVHFSSTFLWLKWVRFAVSGWSNFLKAFCVAQIYINVMCGTPKTFANRKLQFLMFITALIQWMWKWKLS